MTHTTPSTGSVALVENSFAAIEGVGVTTRWDALLIYAKPILS